MIILIIAALVFLVLVILIYVKSTENIDKAKDTNSSSPHAKSNTSNGKGHSIQDCISTEDKKYSIDARQKMLEAQVEKSRDLVSAARQQGYLTVSTTWINRFNQMVEVSNILNQNLINENNRRLQNDKFHRYTGLHYRSLIMADLAYKDYLEAKAGRDQISKVLLSIGERKIVINRKDKDRLYELKDMFKESTQLLYDRTISLNNKTATLRDKIGEECGERGRLWREERMKRKEERLRRRK